MSYMGMGDWSNNLLITHPNTINFLIMLGHDDLFMHILPWFMRLKYGIIYFGYLY